MYYGTQELFWLGTQKNNNNNNNSCFDWVLKKTNKQ